VVDARGYLPEGPESLAGELVRLAGRGLRRLVVAEARGHRFIANGLGRETHGIRIDVFGSSGDYLASGIDGPTCRAVGTGSAAQIMKGGWWSMATSAQTFMYAARAAKCSSSATPPDDRSSTRWASARRDQRPVWLPPGFMAGDPGRARFVLNGIRFGMTAATNGPSRESLLSRRVAVFIRTGKGRGSLNDGQFATFGVAHWELIRPLLEENERLFGIPISWLLAVKGQQLPPERIYRIVIPAKVRALQAEEAWVSHSPERRG
jgi:hypothetical protein